MTVFVHFFLDVLKMTSYSCYAYGAGFKLNLQKYVFYEYSNVFIVNDTYYYDMDIDAQQITKLSKISMHEYTLQLLFDIVSLS